MSDIAEDLITLDSSAVQILERLAVLGILDAEQFPELSRCTHKQAVTQLTELGWIAALTQIGHDITGEDDSI
jgi:hypothetical protein